MSDTATVIMVRVLDSEGVVRERMLDAEVHDPWAIHPTLIRNHDPIGHTVTHIPTGRAYAVACDLNQARRLVSSLILLGAEAVTTDEEAKRWSKENHAALVFINDGLGITYDDEARQLVGSEGLEP